MKKYIIGAIAVSAIFSVISLSSAEELKNATQSAVQPKVETTAKPAAVAETKPVPVPKEEVKKKTPPVKKSSTKPKPAAKKAKNKKQNKGETK